MLPTSQLCLCNFDTGQTADWVLRRNISRAKIGVSEWAGPTKILTTEDGMLGGRGRVCVRQSFDGPVTIQLYSCAVQLQN
jgi:hypothetical protein